MVRLVSELGMQLQMRQCDCNGAAERTFSTAVIVVCLVRYAISAMRSMVLSPCDSFDCALGLLYPALCWGVFLLMIFDC